jgi:dipeptidyl aminopeptidase/acylaminoacyl peptidase
MFVRCFTFLLVFTCTLSSFAQTRRPMTFEDMMKMRRLGDSTVSPDGRWVLFSATDVNLEKNSRTSHLWIVPTSGGEAHSIEPSAAGESRGRFSPDGKQILFLSPRDGGQQIYLAPFSTDSGRVGPAHKLTKLSTEAEGATWSPDGKQILFTSAVYPDCPAGPNQDSCNKQRDQEHSSSKVKAQIFTHLLYRHWNAFTGEKRSHLFLIPVDGGQVRDLNPGDMHDVPPFSLGGPDAYAFSPDGKEIAFTENLDPVPATSTNADIFTLRLDGPDAKPVKISASEGGDFSPAYSPDGRYIAYRSQLRAGYESDRFRLMLYDRQSRQTKELLPHFDRWIDEFAWAPDSNTIYFVFGDQGEGRIDSVDVDGSHLTKLARIGEYSDLHPTPDGKLLIASKMTVRMPGEIFVLHMDKAEPINAETASKNQPPPGSAESGAYHVLVEEQLTHLNDALLSQLDLPEMQSFFFNSVGKARVQGFLIKPPAFDSAKTYPVKFLIHGGPEGAWGDSWSYRWNPELFAANGYVVVMINPRGSTGYGQAFTDAVNGDWGGKPFQDLMLGLDYAEQHYNFIDKNRECALGASYGGYMANWILGHTDRFKCIVSHDGMFNPDSAFGSTEELWFNQWEFKGTPWTNSKVFEKWSPRRFAPRFKTPTLVIHGQLDYRLDVSEGYQLFTALQLQHVPSEMLYFPDEGHWVLKPQNSQLWNKTINDWVDQWTKK